MKSIFAKAVQGVRDEVKGVPVTGNEELLGQIFSKIFRRSEQQGFGLAQLMSAASFTKAANGQQSEMNDIIESIRGELVNESNTFDSNTKAYLEQALGNPQQLFHVLQQVAEASGGGQQTAAKELSAPADLPTPNEVTEVVEPPTSTEVHVPVEGVSLTLVQSTSDTPSGEESVVASEEDVILQKISNISHLHGYNLKPNGKHSLMDLTTTAFADLFAHFRGKSSCTDATDEEKEIFAYLDGVKTRRNGMKMQKTG